MKKFLSVGMATIASILLILLIVFSVLSFVINDETFITNEFTALELSSKMGISNSDLVRAMVRLIDYMEGNADNIDVTVTENGKSVQMFDFEQEVAHMADVRTIYMTIASYRDTCALIMLVLFLFAAVISFREAPQRLSQGYLSGSFVILLFFGFLGTWAALDFSGFWTFFHQMLFWNDLWLFNAQDSRMINMMPEQLFSDIIGRVFLYAGLLMLALILIAIFALVASSDGYKRRRAAAKARMKAHKAAREAQKKAEEEAKAKAAREKRIAEKKAKKAAAEKRAAKRAEAEAAPVKRAKRPSADNEETPARAKPAKSGARTKRPADAAPAKKKKSRSSVADDTGFFDDDDKL